MRRGLRVFLAVFVCAVALSLASCSGSSTARVCYEVPGFPGKVCFSYEHEGREKQLIVPREMVTGGGVTVIESADESSGTDGGHP